MPFAVKLRSGVSSPGGSPFTGALTFVLLSALFLPAPLPAQGGRPGAALLGLQGVAEASMGGALTPVRESSDEIFGNPASLSRIQHRSVGFAWEQLSSFRSSYRVSGSAPIGEFGGVAAGLLFDGISPIDFRDQSGQELGTGKTGLLLLSVGGSIAIGPGSVGSTLHYLSYSVGDIDGGSSGVSIDLGANISFRERLSFGLVINNLAGILNARYRSGLHEEIPADLRISTSWRQPLEVRHDSVRRDPTGRITVREAPPSTYILGLVEVRAASLDESPLFAFGIEAVPFTYDGLHGVGLRAGLNSRGELGVGTFVDLPLDVGDHPTLLFGGRFGGEPEETALHFGLEFHP